jgi:asparagine synthase (glutamine-hydrolysing)
VGAFALIRGTGFDAERKAAELDQAFARQGFRNRRTVALAGWTLVLCQKLEPAQENLHFIDRENFAFCTGTFVYRGTIGPSALARYLEDARHGTIDWDEALGSYFIATGTEGRVRAHLDPLGSYKVFSGADASFHTSSFLAAAHLARSRTLDPYGVYQYVFEGATFGSRTVFDDVRLFPSEIICDLGGTGGERIETGIVAEFDRSSRMEEHVDRTMAVLRRHFRSLVQIFGDRIDTALSGGYDSRLILALLTEQGCSPRVHVYGRPADADVKAAEAIAQGEKLPLEIVDKSKARRVPPDEIQATVERNFYVFDGTPNDGVIDGGADLETRRARCANGELMLNGGGGEVFRNFFYLPNRRFDARELLWTFYTQFDPAVATTGFSEGAYHDALEDDLRDTLGGQPDPIERPLVELVYPAFRCRYWTGRNTSINNRLGYALTPFLEPAIVRSALLIPLELKAHGAFEAALIRTASASLARYISSYGHDFLGPIPWRRRIADWSTLFRPVILRRYSYRVKQKLRSPTPPYYLGAEYLSALGLDDLPHMSAFFRIDKLRDPQQLNRACTLELLCRAYPPR